MAGPRDQNDNRQLERLESRLGYKFKSQDELVQALTHSSVRKSPEDSFHYERLEFLGDRVLGLCIADILVKKFPSASEGELSLRLNSLVRGDTLSAIADELKLHEFIRTGGDLKFVSGKRMKSVRADVVEALIASVYLDGGLEASCAMIVRLWGNRLEEVAAVRQDCKTALQEWAHSMQLDTPKYRETGKTGPDHEPVFTVEVKVRGKLAGKGSGRTKRLAEQEAARQILIREGVWKD